MDRHPPTSPLRDPMPYPALDAIMKIGSQAVPILLERIATSDDKDTRIHCTAVIMDIKKKDALRIVEEAAVAATRRAERLNQAAAMVKGN